MDIIYGNDESSTSGQSNDQNEPEVKSLLYKEKIEVVDPKDFKMPEQCEKTIDNYINKLDEFYSQIGKEKEDVISQKAKVLEAVMNTDMLKID